MWLYVPNTSTSSPSAQVEPASISASSWQFQALEQSAWWRGKPSRSRHWWQRWNKGSFIRLLCGVMPEPLTAEHGVAQWTASLVASRASLTASPDASREATTTETSGRQVAASSSSRARGSSSSKTSAACSRRGLTKSLAPSGFAETFASLVSRWRADCSRRQKLARAISGNASLSLAWLTPSANEDAAGTVDGKMQRMLTHQAKEVSDQWSTPRASDAEKGGPNQAFGAGGIPLPAQAAQWATPRVSSERTSSIALERPDSVSSLSIAQQAEMVMGEVPREIYLVSEKTQRRLGFDPSSLRDQLTYPVGATLSHPRRSLNPLFVEWLMGWPPAWTLVAWTDFACSETELCLFKQRMRSALLSLGLPHEAPPAQLALFG